jgi:DNA-binding SARP family transcriptional activator
MCSRIPEAELATAERSARDLVARAPFRESGYRVLMAALAARGNTAEALRVYDGLMRLLSDELGIYPASRPGTCTPSCSAPDHAEDVVDPVSATRTLDRCVQRLPPGYWSARQRRP